MPSTRWSKLADVIDWEEIERSFGAHFQTTTGRLYDFDSPIGVVITVLFSLFVGQLTYILLDRPMSIAVKDYLTNKFSKIIRP